MSPRFSALSRDFFERDISNISSADRTAARIGEPAGGGPASSTSYFMNSTIGQGIIGSKSSTNYQLGSLYWPGGILEYLVHLPIVLKNFAP